MPHSSGTHTVSQLQIPQSHRLMSRCAGQDCDSADIEHGCAEPECGCAELDRACAELERACADLECACAEVAQMLRAVEWSWVCLRWCCVHLRRFQLHLTRLWVYHEKSFTWPNEPETPFKCVNLVLRDCSYQIRLLVILCLTLL